MKKDYCERENIKPLGILLKGKTIMPRVFMPICLGDQGLIVSPPDGSDSADPQQV